MKHIATIITGCRISGSIVLLFFPVLSPEFFLVYLICGISDMIDGSVARMTNSAGEFGEKLDTIADILFLTAAFIKFLPVIRLPVWLWIWIVCIAAIKVSSFLGGSRFPHTAMNKLTGLLLFLLPLSSPFLEPTSSAAIVCLFATISALQERKLRK